MARAKIWLISAIALMVAAGARIAAAQNAVPSTLDWQPTEVDAIRVAADSNRFVLVHFYSPSDQACQIIERDIYSQPAVRERIHAKFVPFKVNVDEMPLTAKQNGIDRVPTDLLLDTKGRPAERMSCPTTAEAYLAALESTAAATRSRIEAAQSSVAATTAPAAASPVYSAASPAPTQSLVSQPSPAANPVRYQPPSTAPATTPLAYNQGHAGNTAAAVTQTPAQQSPPQPPAVPAYSDDRYAEFYKRWNAGQQTTAAQSPIVSQPAGPAANTSLVQAPPTTNPQPAAASPPNWGTAGYFGQPSSTAGTGATPPYGSHASTGTGASSPVASGQPAGVPALGLEGYCPVTVIEQKRWQAGDRRWGAVHRGRTYLFAGPMEQKQFMANPDRYSPAISGRDVVAAVDRGQTVEGQRQFGVQDTDGRMYLFATAANRDVFIKNTGRYSAEVRQAENPNRATTWR